MTIPSSAQSIEFYQLSTFPPFSARKKARRKLVRKLEKKGIKWQAQVERRWLANLLANKKAVAPVLRFLKATHVGGKKGAREREKEWERRNDQAAEELLGE